MMWCEKGKFLYPFFILLTQMHEISAPKLTNFHIFIIPLPLKVALFSKSAYLTAHIKINYETGYIGGFLKKHRHVSRTIARAKMMLFVALVKGLQPLTYIA